MKFSTDLLALLAAAPGIIASPFGRASNSLAPVPVTALNCDGSSFQCTANLDFGSGDWDAQWTANIIHNSLWKNTNDKEVMRLLAMAPVPVTKLNCDGSAFTCTANLDFGDGNWIAQWTAKVFQQSSVATRTSMAPVPVTTLKCDGSAFQCTANLDFGSGNWVAQWTANVFEQSSARFLGQ